MYFNYEYFWMYFKYKYLSNKKNKFIAFYSDTQIT